MKQHLCSISPRYIPGFPISKALTTTKAAKGNILEELGRMAEQRKAIDLFRN